ncbi:glycosyltransferase family 4 protein [Phenylobacterium sp. NIBR 498073]|uniref:glycosyltransferase family 4 protein n=1 Tax=Phenylobacterium sp. NIBR 498073 TaxID=3015177 RepID=UPI0022B302AA|nr:glycosyltransferase family 4 protein [Phenylobacterium sp. NIBR 498073]WGU39698.1 glycosyltransferase family 4 protein [Phenylobacterium sp. NIBR 498073]
MSNAAIYFHADSFDTSRERLMGRHSAGESFLRGFLRHAQVDELWLYDALNVGAAKGEAMLKGVEPPRQVRRWIGERSLRQLAQPGCLYYPAADIPAQAWRRQPLGDASYSLCGVTHTTASAGTMDILANMSVAPVQPWDGLITTSRAVRTSVETQIQAMRDYLGSRLGAARFPGPQIATIPLGVNVEDFARTDENRRTWRERLDIPQDAMVVLYVGRLHMAAKMNPALMAMALEAAAKRTGKPIYWVVSGWGHTDAYTETHHRWTTELCPSVHYRPVDGRPADTRFSIWSVADIFISFSDNIQETFGLTPVEAMAAGLPSVVTDWDGYRDTVRHGLDGFRIRTFAPRPSLGGDLAYYHANGWLAYERYLVSAAQMTSIDHVAATEALVDLIENPDLRARMGAAAAEQARQVFDWSRIIPQYQAFWGDLAERRQAAAGQATSSVNPYRMDPFTLFESYPTEALTARTGVAASPGMTWEIAEARLSSGLATIGDWPRPPLAEMHEAFDHVADGCETVGAILKHFPAHRRNFVERGLLWMAKFQVIDLTPSGGPIVD